MFIDGMVTRQTMAAGVVCLAVCFHPWSQFQLSMGAILDVKHCVFVHDADF